METAFDTARREADEEVGLPQNELPPPFRVEHLCELPAQLAITEQAVRPCIAFLHTDTTNSSTSASSNGDSSQNISGESLIPKLNTTEVAAVFSAPFHRFLSSKTEATGSPSPIRYEGMWQTWHGTKWRMHNFFIPKSSIGGDSTGSASAEQVGKGTRDKENSYKVWGLTARILIDSARIAYDEEPEFEYLEDFGEEKLLKRLIRMGKLSGEREGGSMTPRDGVKKEKSGNADSNDASDTGGRDTKL